MSVPDSDMLIALSEVFKIPVSTLLGDNVIESEPDELKAICQKLEIINMQLAQKKITRQKIINRLLVLLCMAILIICAILMVLNSPYLGWDYSDPETAVVGAAFHIFEWLFIRLAPIVFIGAGVGIFLTGRNL